MKSIAVKELMVPLSEYVRVDVDDTLSDCFRALEEDRERKGLAGHAHRDALVFGNGGEFKGKVTMLDVFMALEPNYKRLFGTAKGENSLSADYVAKLYKDYDLWTEPLENLCRDGAEIRVGEIMHHCARTEFMDEGDDLGKALHRFVMGVHQPIIVRRGEEVTGVLRLGDVFEKIRELTLACKP
ncbi:CBS domain-containing protein [Paucidesulfovibrio longus]|uniref:CBS domain-containing protein n=1 Tax=Paucidesulfovibrio longus TaxID=889 RepID=UPI00040BD0CB|nr:CBS domain-containing protein [Paucidesulfovibrio longus]